MKNSGKFPLFYGWQDAYAAFTYSIREKDMIIEYIKNPKEHHKKETFYDEYKRLLMENGIEFDENIYYKYSTLSGLIEKSSIVTPWFHQGLLWFKPFGLEHQVH